MKAITTRSGVAYEGPSIPTNPSPKKLSLLELTQTRMTLELADRSITYPKGLAEDVFVKVGKFHFPTDFVVVDFGRPEISEYSLNTWETYVKDGSYSSTNDKSVNRIDIIDAVCEEYAPEFLGFPKSSGGNPIPTSEPFTFEFILEEIEAYLKDEFQFSTENDSWPIAIRRKIFV
ncbi:hypothetical protein Tco_0973384 [Tanacetum coccineum]